MDFFVARNIREVEVLTSLAKMSRTRMKARLQNYSIWIYIWGFFSKDQNKMVHLIEYKFYVNSLSHSVTLTLRLPSHDKTTILT